MLKINRSAKQIEPRKSHAKLKAVDTNALHVRCLLRPRQGLAVCLLLAQLLCSAETPLLQLAHPIQVKVCGHVRVTTLSIPPGKERVLHAEWCGHRVVRVPLACEAQAANANRRRAHSLLEAKGFSSRWRITCMQANRTANGWATSWCGQTQHEL